jgi:pimeloyl-ACP methyl ester carboxylesterase
MIRTADLNGVRLAYSDTDAIRWPDVVTHLILVATSAGPVRVQFPVVDTDAGLREQFKARWPWFFHGENKHWDLFDSLTFTAGPFNAAFTRELPKYDLRDDVIRLETPMLLVVGRLDAYLPHMEWLADHAKHATLCVLNDVGHFPFVEVPDEFTRTVASFLESAGRVAGVVDVSRSEASKHADHRQR